MNRCKNCDTPLDARFCPQCGQKDIEFQRPLYELLGEVVRETLDIDGRAARTVWTMFSQPGVLTEKYLAGHRRQYTPPVRLYLVVSVLFFLVMAWVVRQGILFDVNADSAGEVRVLAEDLPRLMFVLLPVFALLLKVAFHKRFYFDHLIHALHLHTVSYVLLTLLLPFERAANQNGFVLIYQLVLFVYFAGHLAISFRRVYDATWLVASIKATLVFFAYTTILAISLELASEWPMPT